MRPSTWNWTPVTVLTPSETVAVSWMVPETEPPDAGEVMEMERAPDAAFTVNVAAELVMLPAELLTTTLKLEPLSPEVVAGVV